MIRRAIESATRSWRYERTLRIGNHRIPITVSPSAGLRYLFRSLSSIDPILVAQARDYVKPGHVVWDIGANVGLFAFCAAAMSGPSGKVLAFEPDVWLVETLRRSVARQPRDSAPVEIIPKAVAGRNGARRLHIAKRSRSANFLEEYEDLVPFITGGTAETRNVEAVTLDSSLAHFGAPHIVKIDIEGAELEALQGGKRLLQEVRPVVLCEVFAPTSAQVSKLFHEYGYRLLDAETRHEAGLAPWSTIALPLPR